MNEKIGVVYCIRCYETEKVYIGQTTRNNYEKRVLQHFHNYYGIKTPKLWNAILKYGKEKFYYGVIEECYTSMDDLNDMEKKYIKVFNSINYGYNIKEGGRNGKHSLESRKKMSKSQTGRKHSKETLEKMRLANIGENNPNYGKKASEETKRKMSKSQTGKKHTQQSIEKMKKSHKNKVINEEVKLKISNSKKFKRLKENRKPLTKGIISEEIRIKSAITKGNIFEFLNLETGEVYIIVTGFKRFCQQNEIDYNSMRDILRNKVKYKENKKWTVRKIYERN